MIRNKNKLSGFSLVEVIVGLVMLGIVVLVGFILFHHSNKPDTSSSTSTSVSQTATKPTNQYAILSPATVPSKTAECNQKVTFASSGASGPVTCDGNELNATEWNALSALEPKVMTLGYNATVSQVQAALCSDVSSNVSNVIEAINYQISALYYGWNFASNPSVVLSNGTCSNTDD